MGNDNDTRGQNVGSNSLLGRLRDPKMTAHDEIERRRAAPTLDEVAQVVGDMLTAHKVNPMQRRIETAHAVRLFLLERFPGWKTPNA